MSYEFRASQVALVTNPPANVGDLRDTGSILGSGRLPGEGNGNPLQYIAIYFPGESHGQRSLVHEVTELDTTWQLISNKEVDIKVIKRARI